MASNTTNLKEGDIVMCTGEGDTKFLIIDKFGGIASLLNLSTMELHGTETINKLDSTGWTANQYLAISLCQAEERVTRIKRLIAQYS